MEFMCINWADSQLENIHIEYDEAILLIWNDAFNKRLFVRCTGLVGITNLCVWDDMTIFNACVIQVDNNNDDEYLKALYKAYDKTFDYGGRKLNDGLLKLSVELTNHIRFSVYCLKIEVHEESDFYCSM